MFCPKCGTKIEEGKTECDYCGYDLSQETVVEEAPVDTVSITPQLATTEKKHSAVSPLFYIMAVIVLVLSFLAAHQVMAGGLDIGSIESVGGKTLEEAYYQYLRTVYAGYAMIIRAAGLFFGSVLVYLGIKA